MVAGKSSRPILQRSEDTVRFKELTTSTGQGLSVLLPWTLRRRKAPVVSPGLPHYYSLRWVWSEKEHCFWINKGLRGACSALSVGAVRASLSPARSRGEVQIKHIIRLCWLSRLSSCINGALYIHCLYEPSFLTFILWEFLNKAFSEEWQGCYGWTVTICSVESILAKYIWFFLFPIHEKATAIPRRRGRTLLLTLWNYMLHLNLWLTFISWDFHWMYTSAIRSWES